MKANVTMRALDSIELDQVSGGFTVSGGPVSPEPKIPPIILFGPVHTPQHGPNPSPYPNPIIGPFPIH